MRNKYKSYGPFLYTGIVWMLFIIVWVVMIWIMALK